MPIELSSYFQPFRDRVSGLATQYSLHQSRRLVIVKRSGSTTYLEIDPRPTIRRINPKMVDLYSKLEGVQVEVDDFEVVVSKSYSLEQISGRGISYLVDAMLVDGVPSGGIECDRVIGMDIEEQDLSWKLLLRRRK